MSDVAATLDQLADYFRAYVVMSAVQCDAAALWTFHTHAFGAAEATPYLHVTSAMKESGKTRFLEVAELVVARPLKTGGTTAAALARAVAQDPPPTMLLDETDNAFKRDREYVAALLGILNDGYRRGGRTLLCLPPKWEPSFLPVFAPKVVAGLGQLPDTLASRSIRLELKRRSRDEPVERFRRRLAEERAEPIKLCLESLAAHNADRLALARPELPDELGDRAQDVWEPLLAIAYLAGGEWPHRARRAAIQLSARGLAEDDSLDERLLGDVRTAFAESDRLSTHELLSGLNGLEESPWGNWDDGKGLRPRSLAGRLKRFGIVSRTVRLDDGTTPKGYLREQFEDAWKRYLPDEDPSNLPDEDPSKRHTATTRMDSEDALFSKTPQTAGVADSGEAANPHGSGVVADVADRAARNGKRALVGDRGYYPMLVAALDASHITEAEADKQYRLHQLVELSRREPEELAF